MAPTLTTISPNTAVREFASGATRDTDDGKMDYEGFLSPLVIRRYAEYMHKHRKQSDGSLRDSDNWQKGMPLRVYMKSLWRHFMVLWETHRGVATDESREETLCAIIFNASGYLHEMLKKSVDVDVGKIESGDTNPVQFLTDCTFYP